VERKALALNPLEMERFLGMPQFEEDRVRTGQATEVMDLLFSYV
jgi:hypothetical protein